MRFPRVSGCNGFLAGLIAAIALLYSVPTAWCQAAGPELSVVQIAPGALTVSWPRAAGNYVLESVETLGRSGGWTTVAVSPGADTDRFFVTLRADQIARFFRLRFSVGQFRVTAVTPAAGATEVGVTVRPQVVFSQPVNVSSLNPSNFFASFAGQQLPATIVPANDGSFAWLFFKQPMPGGARILVTVDGSSIKSARDGSSLDADGDGQPGGIRQFDFTTVNLEPVPGTSLSGIVVDPGPDLIPRTADDLRAGPDGVLGTADDVFLLPIEGVEVHLIGREDVSATTEADGRFQFDSVPAGDVKIVINGNTATAPPPGIYFPEMVIDATMVTGKENWTMSNGPEVYLPRLATNILQAVNSATNSQIVATPAGAPQLSAFQRNQLSINIQPGSLIGPDGQPLAGAQVGISTVPADVVRDMLPPGVLQHTFDITVQAPGVATFATPAPMSFPNVFNAAPGTKLNFLSFDHTTGRLVIEGTATVAADGSSVQTDPGTGVTHPGWHGLTPPGSQNDPPCQPTKLPEKEVEPVPQTDGLQDYLFYQESGAFTLNFRNAATRLNQDEDPCSQNNMKASSLLVVMQLDDGIAAQFMDGLASDSFELKPGQSRDVEVNLRPLQDLMFLPQFEDSDVLFGVRVKVQLFKVGPGGNVTELEAPAPFFIYRYLDTCDTDHSDGQLKFPDALAEGSISVSRVRPLLTVFAGDAIAQLKLDNSQNFQIGGFMSGLVFQPKEVAPDLKESLHIIAPSGDEVGAGQMVLQGQGTPRFSLFFNTDGLKAILKAIAEKTDPGKVNYQLVTSNEVALIDTEIKRTGIAGEVKQLAEEKYAEFSEGLEFTESSGPYSINVFWGYDALGGFGVAPPGVDDDPRLGEVLATYQQYNRPAQNYLLASALNNRFTDPVLISVREMMEEKGGRFSLPLELSRLDLINFLVKVVTHESGHTLGAVHTSIIDPEDPEFRLFLGGVDGFGDLMSSAFSIDGSQVFERNYSREMLLMGTKINWTPAEAQTALRLLVASTVFQTFTPPRTQTPATTGNIDMDGGTAGNLTPVPGPHLAVFDDAGNLLSTGELTFEAPVNGASATVKTFSLFNYGSEPALIGGAHWLRTNTAFSVTGLGTAVINPTQTNTFQISFKPTMSGESSALLEIIGVSSVSHRLSLRGVGKVQGPDLRLSFSNNNLGGVAIGKTAQVQNWGSISNLGTEPLVISRIGPDAQVTEPAFQAVGLPVELAGGASVTLAPGQALSFGVAFSPAKVGLQRGALQIASNDRNQPVREVRLVGTGLAASGQPRDSLKYGKDFVAIATPDQPNAPVLSATTDFGGNFQFFLPPNQGYRGAIFDPVSGLIATISGISASSGEKTPLGIPDFRASTAPDSDGDGLPDDIEFAVRSDPNNVDTDGDGIDDFTAVLQAGMLKAPSFISSVSAGDTVANMALVPATEGQTDALYAYLAARQNGVIIADVTDPLAPEVLANINGIGAVQDVAVSPALQRAVVTSSLSTLGDPAARSGTRIYDVSNPRTPKLLTFLDAFSWEVEIVGDYAYVLATDDQLNGIMRAVNIKSGQVENELHLDKNYDYLVRDQDLLVLSGFSAVQLVQVAGPQMTARGKYQFPGLSGRPAVYNGIAYFAQGQSSLNGDGGYATLDLSDRDEPKLIQGAMNPESANLPFGSVALTGSGRILLGGSRSTGFFDSNPAIDLLDARDPANTYAPVAKFDSTDPDLLINQLSVANGVAFVATSSAMLAFRFVDADQGSVPPDIRSVQVGPDADPNKAGPQVAAGSRIYVSPDLVDDVQVRQADLLIDGQVVQSTVIAPFRFELLAPNQPGGGTFTVQIRATDTGGNSRVSAALTVETQ